jgi:hypothetical protein
MLRMHFLASSLALVRFRSRSLPISNPRSGMNLPVALSELTAEAPIRLKLTAKLLAAPLRVVTSKPSKRRFRFRSKLPVACPSLGLRRDIATT